MLITCRWKRLHDLCHDHVLFDLSYAGCAPTAHEIFFTLSVLPTYSPYGAMNVFAHPMLPTFCPDGAMNVFTHSVLPTFCPYGALNVFAHAM